MARRYLPALWEFWPLTLLEVLQSLTEFRSAELADLVADALGALLAYFVLRRLAAGVSDAASPPQADA